MVSAILLAAGESRRMGAPNKLLLPWRNSTVIGQVIHNLMASKAEEVIVVLGHEADRVRDALKGKDLLFAENPRYAEGMTSSIQAGVRRLSASCQGFLVCLADQPLLSAGELNRIIERFREMLPPDPEAIIQPTFQGQAGNPVLFSAAYRERILAHREPNGCKAIVKAYAAHVKKLEMPDDHILRDLDTPEDYLSFPGMGE